MKPSVFHYFLILSFLSCLSLSARAQRPSTTDPLIFDRDIRPVLSDKCFQCHGPDEEKRQRKLRLDVRAIATGKLASGKIAIVPGSLEKSELVRRITTDDPDEHMPPAESHKSLSRHEVELLKRWIAEGARYEKHWAFIPPRRPPLPTVQHKNWPSNPIDRFILARLERAGLSPAPPAGREAMIRRVTLDLTGLPPTIAEIDAFLADDSPDAYEKLVDRLLKSPHYGEQMARVWLDLARYADTHGYQYDQERTMWPWRDWVIHAYNANMPFDQFTIEQLAGDLLPDATASQRLATAFNRNHGITVEGGIIDAEYRTEYVIDRIKTMSTAWLGLTLGCARCHDHKFDPVSQTEFYQLFDFFNQVPEAGNGSSNQFAPTMKVVTAGQRAEVARLDRAIADKTAELRRLMQAYASQRADWQRSLASRSQARWSVLKPVSMKAGDHTTLTLLEDNSILASGDADKETYEITLRTDQTHITAIRLEALTHDTLPHHGPGRADNANFVLTEFEARAVSLTDPSHHQPIRFTSAVADYSQKGYDISRAIDGDLGDTNGWAIDGLTRREDRTAVFVAGDPFGFPGGTELRVRLHFKARWANHAIGRARFAITRHGLPAIPLDIDRILSIAPARRSAQQTQRLDDYYLAQYAPAEVKRVYQRLQEMKRDRHRVVNSFPTVMIMRDMPKKRETHFLYRGQYNQPRQRVSADVPEALGALPPGAPHNRLGLARWLVNPHHPLTARVTVNRYWQKYFGAGIVKTTGDFGSQGAWPSHPALLDWLAVEFIESGWNVKHMQKLIVTSAAYRQSSRVTSERLEKDPANRLISRGPRLRMQAETIRDTMLVASGLLTEKIGGPSVYPYQPPGLWMELNNRKGYSTAYKADTGENLYRRSLYTFWKRTVPPPPMQAFDAPEREFCTVHRSRTNTPLQALVLLDDPQFVEAARHLARRMMTEAARQPADRITYGFRLVSSRKPHAGELALLQKAYKRALTQYRGDPQAAKTLLSVGDSSRDPSLDLADHAAWTTVARIIMNLDEAITK